MSKAWSPMPIHLSVVELLEKKGALTDVEVLKELKSLYGDMSLRELNMVLLRLEVSGVLRVSRLMKGKRRIELVEEKQRTSPAP